jgi:hypothetical protein
MHHTENRGARDCIRANAGGVASRGGTTAAVVQVLRDACRYVSAREVMDELRGRGQVVRGPYAVRVFLTALARRGAVVRQVQGHLATHTAC